MNIQLKPGFVLNSVLASTSDRQMSNDSDSPNTNSNSKIFFICALLLKAEITISLKKIDLFTTTKTKNIQDQILVL